MSSFDSDTADNDGSRMRLEWPGGARAQSHAAPPVAEEAAAAVPEPEPPAISHASTEGPTDDLSALRSEVAALRRSIDEQVDRGPAVGLTAVLHELVHLRAEVSQLGGASSQTAELGSLAPLLAEVAALRAELSLEPVMAELSELRKELVRLRRRVGLRAESVDYPGF